MPQNGNNVYFSVVPSQVTLTIFFVFSKLKKMFTLNAFFDQQTTP